MVHILTRNLIIQNEKASHKIFYSLLAAIKKRLPPPLGLQTVAATQGLI